MLKRGTALFCICFAAMLIFSGAKEGAIDHADQVLSAQQQREDFLIWRKKIEKNHPNLYLYTTKVEMDQYFDSLYAQLDHPQTSLLFLSDLASIYRKINDGHTFFIPGDKDISHFNQTRNFLPLDITLREGKLFVLNNLSPDTSIARGSEVLEINKVPSSRIIDTLLQRQVRDGNNCAYASWIIDSYFRQYYSFSFGHPNEFIITFKCNGLISTLKLNALSRSAIAERRTQVDLVADRSSSGIQLTPSASGNQFAVLRIPSFDDAVLKQAYDQNFTKQIHALLQEVIAKNYTHLILDLRDNQGGNPANGKLLLSYLLDTSFYLVWQGPSSGKVKPRMNTYKGKIICLTNGGSFSVTGMVCAALSRHHRCTFVGEETGGNRTVVSGSATSFHLPNSEIYCEVSTKSWVLSAAPNCGCGVLPDVLVPAAAAELLTGSDTQLESALMLCSQ